MRTSDIKAALALAAVAVLRPFKCRPLWLISDRSDLAGDNGEAFFRYLCQYHPEIHACFSVSRKAPQYIALKKAGTVIPWHSWRRKILTLLSDCMISSHLETAFTNPFWGYDEPYRKTLSSIPFVFLQHGVTKDNISRWLSERERKIDAVVTASPRERDAFLDLQYGFRRDAVWLVGFPRFDLLNSCPQKKILVMPTWRRYLDCRNFTASAFYMFFSELLSDAQLIEGCRRFGYRIVFVLHPNFKFAQELFDSNAVVDVVSGGVDYAQLLGLGAMLVTDYSSIAFDFAYMRKPIVYAQFDLQEFNAGKHSYDKGYFDYYRDGFGPVATTIRDTVDAIVNLLNSSCHGDREYLDRMRRFFAYKDTKNCHRVFEKIWNSWEARVK